MTTAADKADKARADAEQAAADAAKAEQARLEAEYAARAEKYAGKTVTLKTVDVVVVRNDTTEVPDTVFEHELPVLKAMFGGENFVRVTGEDTAEYEDFNAASELERLRRKYAPREGTNPVDLIYRGNAAEIAKAAGVSYSPTQQAAKPAKSSQTPAKKKVIGRKR